MSGQEGAARHLTAVELIGMPSETLKLVEECTGEGELLRRGEILGRVRYRISRYQGMLEGSGLPVPGMHRIEGSIDLDDATGLVGASLTLRLEDGRSLPITLAEGGRVLTEGHGPAHGCSCC
jgi:hypothetical protein